MNSFRMFLTFDPQMTTWEAFCKGSSVKSMIGNYRGNHFISLFQTAMEIFLHRSEFLNVLDFVSSPNLRLLNLTWGQRKVPMFFSALAWFT